MGFFLHHTVFQSKWFVTAEPDDPSVGDLLQIDGLTKKQALLVFDDLVAAIARNQSLSDFEAARRGRAGSVT